MFHLSWLSQHQQPEFPIYRLLSVALLQSVLYILTWDWGRSLFPRNPYCDCFPSWWKSNHYANLSNPAHQTNSNQVLISGVEYEWSEETRLTTIHFVSLRFAVPRWQHVAPEILLLCEDSGPCITFNNLRGMILANGLRVLPYSETTHSGHEANLV